MEIFSIFSLLSKGIGWLLLLLIVFAVFQFIVRPIMKQRFYKKQGLPTFFVPIMGTVGRDRKFEKTKGDILYYYKNLPQDQPTLRAVVGNFSSRVDVMLFDPKLIKEFFHNQSLYKKSPATNILKTLIGTGLLFAEDNVWKHHRKVIAGVFHFEFLRQSVPLVVSTAQEFLNKIEQTSVKRVDILSEIQKITGENIGRMFFSENLNNYQLKGKPLTLYLAELPAKSGRIFKNPLAILLLVTRMNLERLASYREVIKDILEFRETCKAIVAERKASNKQVNDLMGQLLKTQESANEDDRFTDEDIVNEFITFFLGGMDSTAHLINMVIYNLAANQELLGKVRQEVMEKYASVETPTTDTLNSMELLHGILKETLRMYPPAPAPASRMAVSDHNLGDLKIKRGDFVRPMPMFNFFDEKHFEEPNKFKPERWLAKKDTERDPYVYIPFSAGPRNCIGQHQAMMSAKIIVAEFVRKFAFKLDEGYELKMTFGSLYEPKQRLLLDLEPIN